jgi:hypothetical protein
MIKGINLEKGGDSMKLDNIAEQLSTYNDKEISELLNYMSVFDLRRLVKLSKYVIEKRSTESFSDNIKGTCEAQDGKY